MANLTIKIEVADEVAQNPRLAKHIISEVLNNDEVIDTIVVRVSKRKRRGPAKRKGGAKARAIQRMLRKSERPLQISAFMKALKVSRDYARVTLQGLIDEGLVEQFQMGPVRGFGKTRYYVWKDNEAQMDLATRPEGLLEEESRQDEVEDSETIRLSVPLSDTNQPFVESYVLDNSHLDVTI